MTMQAEVSTEAFSAQAREAKPGLLRRYPQLTISPAILVILLAGWWLACHVFGAPSYVVPAPENVWRALINGLNRAPWDSGGYWFHAGITVWEALLGFAQVDEEGRADALPNTITPARKNLNHGLHG